MHTFCKSLSGNDFPVFPLKTAESTLLDYTGLNDIARDCEYTLRTKLRTALRMAYIAKHKDGYRAQVARRGVRVSAVWPTKREAVEWARRKELEIEAGKGKYSFSDLCDKYLKTVTPNKRSKVNETRRIEEFRAYFLGVNLADIDAPQIGEWRDSRLKTVSASTVQREASILRNMFKVAQHEYKWIEHYPFSGVKLPTENAPRHQVWGWREIKRVFRAQTQGKTQEVVQAFHIALRTAMRLQECLLAPERFDAKRRIVSFAAGETKSGRREEVPLTRHGVRLVNRGKFTVGPNEASVLFSKLCRQLLIKDLHFHDARATALTHMARKMDVLTLSRISRHKDLRQLMTYYRETAEQISRRI